MAEYMADPDMGGAGLQASKWINVSAAAISVALIAGVGVWGYKLLVRDVTGVPVVRAMEGDMRVAPENPGGEIASHVGLSVNSVPADGGAAEPEDRLVLAPSGVALLAEDMDVGPLAEATEVEPTPAPVDEALAEAVAATLTDPEEAEPAEQVAAIAAPVAPEAPLTAEDVLALADQIAAGASPLTDLAEGETAPVEVAVNGVAVNPEIIPDAVPGVRRSLRPTVRPASLRVPSAPAQAVAPVAAAAPATTGALPAGTKLVQLGAFDSAEIAASEWVRLTGQFPDFFDGKQQVIQEATSGGRQFFRQRAMGFADLNDARRFCSAMSAEGAPCIPVVVR